MLTRLELKDFAIVDELAIELGAGLNVLTGETGTGKSIVVDGLALLAGMRPDATMIRSGRDQALVQGLFAGASVASAARRLVRDGRNTARLDGELVAVAELAERAGDQIAIFGQHASRRLLEPAEQLAYLDRLLGEEGRAARERYVRAYGEYQRVAERLRELKASGRERERRLDMLRFQLDEIDAAALTPGEEERLEQEAKALRNAEKIVSSVARVAEALAQGEPNAADMLAVAQRDLEGAARYDRQLEILASDLQGVARGARAVADELVAFLDRFERDPARLDRVESRLATIERLERKYGSSVEEVLAYRETVAAELQALDLDEADRAELEARLEAVREELSAAGRALSVARHDAGARLVAGVRELMPRLAMPDGRFEAAMEPTGEPSPTGLERVALLFSANPGEPLQQLADVASGGELSRLMLAVHVVTGTDVPTIVFDEVDAGIGGRTARAVGELLKTMARDRQVLVVTHLPQVAAFADLHFAVTKVERDGRTVARVRRLDEDGREAELARMLSGSVTPASRSNARELMSAAAAGAA